jgi:hypothetical protein
MVRMRPLRLPLLLLLFLSLLCLGACPAQAVQLRVGPQSLQHALTHQLQQAPDGRYYLHGRRSGGCALYATDVHVHFAQDRIVLDLHLEGKIGADFAGGCLGVHWAGDAEVSMLPQAQGAKLGFTDVRVEKVTGAGDIGGLLAPLLESRVPRNFSIDAASLVGRMLHSASVRSQTPLSLDNLSITSMQVVNNALLLGIDGSISMP